MRQDGKLSREAHVDFSSDDRLRRRTTPLVRNVRNRYACVLLEHLDREMTRRAVAVRTRVELAAVLPRDRDELPDGLRRHAGVHDENQRGRTKPAHRCEVLQGIEAWF